ncbi:MAG: multicopper oxidase domain-containing protein [Bacteroidota bacterium]
MMTRPSLVTVTRNPLVPLSLLISLWFILIPGILEAQFTTSTLGNVSLTNATSIQFGPDGMLYVGQQNGQILMLKVNRTAPNDYTAQSQLNILLIKEMQNHKDDGTERNEKESRQLTGFVVSGTADKPIIYTTSSDWKIGGPSGDKDLDTNSGIISKLTWTGNSSPANTNLGSVKDEDVWEKVDLVRGLPRSEENHATNGIALTTLDGKPFLLVCSGGHTNAGSPSEKFTKVTEYALSAAVLSVDLDALADMSIKGAGTEKYVYDLPTVDDPTRDNVNGITDPDAAGYDGKDIRDPFGGNDGLNQAKIVPGGPVQIFSPGFRNTYDLVVTENRRVYATDNGANKSWGGMPKNEGPPLGGSFSVTNEYHVDGNGNELGSTNEASYNGQVVNNKDHLELITGVGINKSLDNYSLGSFYAGHPNPIRANPQGANLYTHHGENESDDGVYRTSLYDPSAGGDASNPSKALPADWPPLPIGNKNPIEGDFQNPGEDDQAIITWTKNTNGIDEYTASNFNGLYKGDLIIGTSNSALGGGLYRIQLKEDGSLEDADLAWKQELGNPLGVSCQGDNDIFPGTIWLASHTGFVKVLEPSDYCQDNPNSNGMATISLDTDSDNIDASTHNASSFQITNNSPGSKEIEKVTIDLSTAWLPDLVFDPGGGAGDAFGKTLTSDTGGSATGFDSFQFSKDHQTGKREVTLFFTDFDPGETFSFSVDIDPTSIQGSQTPGPSSASFISGMELTGTTVSVSFSDCATATGQIFAKPNTASGATVCVSKQQPAQPSINALGITGPYENVFEASQTIRVSGSAGSKVVLLQAEMALSLAGDGFDIDPYEANRMLSSTIYSATIGATGSVDIPVTLTATDETSGHNHFVAAVEEGGCYGPISSVWKLTLIQAQGVVKKTVYINKGIMLTPDEVALECINFNDSQTFSATNAVISLSPGSELELTVVNTDSNPHNIQIKGKEVNDQAIPAGEQKTYIIEFPSEGVFLLHDNLKGKDNRYLGLGAVIHVHEFSGSTFYWNLKEHYSNWNFLLEYGGAVNYQIFEPDYFTINGLSQPDLQDDPTAALHGKVGEAIRLVIANTGLMKHSIHFHGYHLEIISSSKYPSHVGRIKDSFPIDPMESLVLELIPDKPGEFPVHDHNLYATTGGGMEPNGMLILISIEE